MYQCGHLKSRQDFFSRVALLRSTRCHQSVLSSAKLCNTKRGSFIFSIVLFRITVTIFIILNCHKHLSWQVPLKGLPYKTWMHEWRWGKKTFFFERIPKFWGQICDAFTKSLFSDFTPIPTYFRILIAHSTTIKCHYRTTTIYFDTKRMLSTVTQIFIAYHTLSYQYYKQLVPKFTNLNGAPISSILNSK